MVPRVWTFFLFLFMFIALLPVTQGCPAHNADDDDDDVCYYCWLSTEYPVLLNSIKSGPYYSTNRTKTTEHNKWPELDSISTSFFVGASSPTVRPASVPNGRRLTHGTLHVYLCGYSGIFMDVIISIVHSFIFIFIFKKKKICIIAILYLYSRSPFYN
jgi:hypothetical protein